PRDEVERAFGLRQEDPGDLPQPFVENVAATLVLGDDLRHVFRAEVARADRDELRETRRREAPLRHPEAGPTHLAVAGDETAEPQPAGAVTLREAVHHDDRVFGSREPERAHGPTAVVDELPVDLVDDQEEAAVAAEARDRLE